MKPAFILLLFALHCVFSPPAIAASRPLVEVKFSLKEPTWRRQFLTETNPATGLTEMQEFEQKVSRDLESVFASKVGFLDFRPGTNAYRLSIAVEPEQSVNTESLVNTRFILQLRSPSSEILGSAQWLFRKDVEYNLSVVAADFGNEVTNRLAIRLNEDLVGAVTRLFSNIPLSTEIYLIVGAPVICILPLSFDELKMDQNSGFEIQSSFKVQNAKIPRYHGLRAFRPDQAFDGLPPLYSKGIVGIEDANLVRRDRNSKPHPHTEFTKLGTTDGPVQGIDLYVTDYVPLVLSEDSEASTGSPAGFSPQ